MPLLTPRRFVYCTAVSLFVICICVFNLTTWAADLSRHSVSSRSAAVRTGLLVDDHQPVAPVIDTRPADNAPLPPADNVPLPPAGNAPLIPPAGNAPLPPAIEEPHDVVHEKDTGQSNQLEAVETDTGHLEAGEADTGHLEAGKADTGRIETKSGHVEAVEPIVEKKKEAYKADLDFLYSLDYYTLSLEQIDSLYQINKELIGQRLEARNDAIGQVCKDIHNRRFNRPYLFYIKEYSVSWCPTYKAGSTVWKDFFVQHVVDSNLKHPSLEVLWKFRLSAVARGRPPSTPGRLKYVKEPDGTTRFTVVRNPIVRVISYLKMATRCSEMARVGMHYDLMLQRKLPDLDKRDQFRKEMTEFQSWCEKVADVEHDKQKMVEMERERPFASPDNPYLNPPHITFTELVNKMKTQREKLRSNDWEGHWAPASEWCDICVHGLDYVPKLEHQPWELWFLLERIGLWGERAQFLDLHNSASKAGRPSDSSEIAEYVSQLSDELRTFLNTFYNNDMRMFGYDKV